MSVNFVKYMFLGLIIFLIGCSSSPYSDEQREDLALCLIDSGTIMYGAFWCSHCQDQKELFGKYAFKTFEENGGYVECDPRGDNAQPERCLENDVEGYPTWVFPDNSRLTGSVQLETLAGKTDCTL